MKQENRVKLKHYLESPNTYASTLMCILMDSWDVEFFSWEPDTLLVEAAAEWEAIIPEENRDKIWAAVTLLTTDKFYTSVSAFIHICNAFSMNGTNFVIFDPATIDEIAWAVTEATLLDPPEARQDPTARYSDNIKRYIGMALTNEGVSKPPPLLKFSIMPEQSSDASEIFGDDEMMATAFWKRAQSEIAAIEDHVKSNLTLMLNQISQLPLTKGKPQNIHNLSLSGQRS